MAAKPVKKQKVLVTEEILWTLHDLTQEAIVQFESGKGFASNAFKLRFKNKISKWCLCLYPNGSYPEVKSCITVCLNALDLTDEPFDVKYKFEISGFSWSRSSPQLYNPSKDFLVDCLPFHFKHVNLFDPAKTILSFAGISILCKISLLASKDSKTSKAAETPFRYHSMFGNDFLSDFEFKASDGETLKTHKFVLAASSPVFYAMLSGDTKETQEGSVHIPDFDSKTLKEVLRFMYSNKVENLDEIVCDLVFAAEKYQLDELKEICINHIIASLTTDNVWTILAMADQLSDSSRLYKKCLKIMDRHGVYVNRGLPISLPGHVGSRKIYELLNRESFVRVSTYQNI